MQKTFFKKANSIHKDGPLDKTFLGSIQSKVAIKIGIWALPLLSVSRISFEIKGRQIPCTVKSPSHKYVYTVRSFSFMLSLKRESQRRLAALPGKLVALPASSLHTRKLFPHPLSFNSN
jgi:hypothetical protein